VSTNAISVAHVGGFGEYGEYTSLPPADRPLQTHRQDWLPYTAPLSLASSVYSIYQNAISTIPLSA